MSSTRVIAVNEKGKISTRERKSELKEQGMNQRTGDQKWGKIDFPFFTFLSKNKIGERIETRGQERDWNKHFREE